MDKSSPRPSGPAGSLLVSPGKSSRLREMRERAAAANRPAPVPPSNKVLVSGNSFSPELALARQLIDQRLTEIMASLPAGKQQRLFKIRFGIEPNRLKDLPIKQIFKLLKIDHPQFNSQSTNMKRVGDLNYNGRQPN